MGANCEDGNFFSYFSENHKIFRLYLSQHFFCDLMNGACFSFCPVHQFLHLEILGQKKYASNVLDITNKPLQLLKFQVLSVPIKKDLKLFPAFFFSPLSYDQLSVHPPEHDDDGKLRKRMMRSITMIVMVMSNMLVMVDEDGDGGNVDGHTQGDGELTKLAP